MSHAPPPKGSHIFYASNDPIDCAHVEHVSGLPGVYVYPVDFGGHAVAYYLVKSGFFRAEVQRSLGLTPDA
jgi:hypothetical protein